MTTATSTERVRDLLDGLQPPCAVDDLLVLEEPCSETATHLAWLIDRHGIAGPKIPMCPRHVTHASRHYATCAFCGRLWRFASEPI